MIQFKCQHCGKEMRIADEHGGKKVRCPKCQEVLVAPVASTAVKPSAPAPAPTRKPAPPPLPAAAEVELELLEEADDDRERDRDRDDEDDDDRGRRSRERGRRRRRRRSRGAHADCPECGEPGYATPVAFTWWGGIVGPRLFNHVRCDSCGTCYNGKTGRSNTTAITIYVVVTGLIAVMVAVCAGISAALNH